MAARLRRSERVSFPGLPMAHVVTKKNARQRLSRSISAAASHPASPSSNVRAKPFDSGRSTADGGRPTDSWIAARCALNSSRLKE